MAMIRAVKIKKRYIIGCMALLVLSVQFYKMAIIKREEQHIAALSYVLTNKVIVVDPGHGGRDPGKIGVSGVPEKEINLEVAKRLATLLGEMGAAVILTRDTDMDLSDASTPGNKKRQDLSRRAETANERNADLFISIHCNGFTSPQEHGAQVFSQPHSPESKILAECIQKEMTVILGNTKRKAKQVDYYVTRTTKMPAAIVEIGFITNPKEDKLLQDPLYQSKVAWSIAAGIIKYYEGKENGKEDPGIKEKEVLQTFRRQPGNYIPAP
ncbi:N-acetylmuramoyl-L-alanine amidase [Desulforamulus putei DSM 12395]|uniref:N-acetylmuramoyl-L-alanine amidase n=2 Tax=Desulforamulus putei TaxID=74701 RepID=A0A1M4WFD0_9FIRM|nr:N-acetylmuramoyl-L-alanine amidase [Desulforamulus putei DSM 12395]